MIQLFDFLEPVQFNRTDRRAHTRGYIPDRWGVKLARTKATLFYEC